MPRTDIDRSGRAGYLLATPYVIFLLAFGVGPTVYAVYLSVVNTNTGQFAGWANYVRMFSDFRFLPALWNITVYIAVWFPMMIVGVLFLALLLHARPGRFASGMRLLYYLPSAVTGSANVLLWMFIVDPSVGPFQWLLRGVGWHSRSDILQDSHLAYMYAVIAFTHGVGSWIVILHGGLQSVSIDLIDAAEIDGCNAWKLAWHVKLPLVRKYVTYMLIISVSGGIQLFAEPQLVNTLAHVGSQWWSPNQLAYYVGFNDGQLGAAGAMSVALLVLSVLASLFVVLRTDFFETEIPK